MKKISTAKIQVDQKLVELFCKEEKDPEGKGFLATTFLASEGVAYLDGALQQEAGNAKGKKSVYDFLMSDCLKTHEIKGIGKFPIIEYRITVELFKGEGS